ncbi:hypothetical protein CapIbe_001959 [Capra ibex]
MIKRNMDGSRKEQQNMLLSCSPGRCKDGKWRLSWSQAGVCGYKNNTKMVLILGHQDHSGCRLMDREQTEVLGSVQRRLERELGPGMCKTDLPTGGEEQDSLSKAGGTAPRPSHSESSQEAAQTPWPSF